MIDGFSKTRQQNLSPIVNRAIIETIPDFYGLGLLDNLANGKLLPPAHCFGHKISIGPSPIAYKALNVYGCHGTSGT